MLYSLLTSASTEVVDSVASSEVVNTAAVSNALDGVLNTLVNWALTTGVKILIALLLLWVSFRIINSIGKKIEANKKNLDKTMVRTLAYVFRLAAKVIVIICLIGYLGIDTSGLTALVASFGVCVGLAVNGALSNVAGGVLILVTRPFRVDDFIEAQGHSGTVLDIHMTNTKLLTPDNKVIYVPNGALANGNIVNYSEKDTRRVDLQFSIAYENDFEKAKSIVLDICNAHQLVLKETEPFVRVNGHGDSCITIVTRVWANSADYWTVYFDLLEQVKAEFDKQGIEIPYNQLDVHIKNN